MLQGVPALARATMPSATVAPEPLVEQAVVEVPQVAPVGQVVPEQVPVMPAVPVAPATQEIMRSEEEADPVATWKKGMPPPEGYETKDVMSAAGWTCLLACMPAFPLNLLGLCMTEKQLVPTAEKQAADRAAAEKEAAEKAAAQKEAAEMAAAEMAAEEGKIPVRADQRRRRRGRGRRSRRRLMAI